jgi:hypothetical protein
MPFAVDAEHPALAGDFIRNLSAMPKHQPFRRLLVGRAARKASEVWLRCLSGARRPQPRHAPKVD